MMLTRRQILKTGSAFAASTLIGQAADPVLGMIFPSARPVPPEVQAMYPSGVKILTGGVGLETMTPEGYDSVIDKIIPETVRLQKEGAKAVMLMGTSLSFYKGAAFNQSIGDSMRKATGLPCSTMSTAIVEGLKAVSGKRLAVPTAYNEDVTNRLRVFLNESGFEVLAIKGMGLERIGAAGNVDQKELEQFALSVFAMAPKADAMFVSCGGLRTLELIAPWEKQTRVPVVSSTPHAAWAAVRLVGLSGRAPGYGQLLSRS